MMKTGKESREKILLALLPYWSPVIPPTGPAALKSFLEPHGYRVKTVDLVAKKESLGFYYGYFNLLKKYIPEEKRGTFYNIGHDLLENHMTAYLNRRDESRYTRLVQSLVYNYYYVRIDDAVVRELTVLLEDYFRQLRRYFLFLLKFEKPDVVGLTVYKTNLPASLFILQLIAETAPHIRRVIGGGIFADSLTPGSPNFERFLEYSRPTIDKIFIGQGELLFLKYLRGELPPSQRVYTAGDLGSETLEFEDIDIPDYSDFNIYKYSHMAATASVSCMYRCSFCNEKNFWGRFKKKDIRLVADQMVKLNKTHDRQLFFMTDSLLNPVITDLANELIRRDVTLYYDTYFRVDDASTRVENTMLWRRGGLYRVRMGLESGSQRILDMMGKQINLEQIRGALTSLSFAGIKTTTYWLIGHPGETEADFQKTLDIVEEFKDCIWQAECNPFRYFYNAQNSADDWARHRVPLYSDEDSEMLVFKEWTLDIEPRRELVYQRVTRFINHCKKLGIPNPYSTFEYFEADRRWQRLHKNAVPPMQDFNGVGAYVDEIKQVQHVTVPVNKRTDDLDFDF